MLGTRGTQDCRRHPENLRLCLHHGDKPFASHISGLRIRIISEQEGMILRNLGSKNDRRHGAMMGQRAG